MRQVRDQYLPPDHDAFVAAEPPTGRVIVIAPTRAACETIEIGLQLDIETYLEKHHGARLRELAASGRGFGIVAGTGTGKTLAVRPIAETILRDLADKLIVKLEANVTVAGVWEIAQPTNGVFLKDKRETDVQIFELTVQVRSRVLR